jgi:hypothetical protein
MKHLILAATFSLIAAPAFAGDSVHEVSAPKVKTFTDTQVGSDTRDTDSARDQRNANLRHAAQDRSENARAAMRGLPHYY